MTNVNTINLPDNHVTDAEAQMVDHVSIAGVHLYRFTGQAYGCHTARVLSIGRKNYVRIEDQFERWGDIFSMLDDAAAWYVKCGSILSRDDSNEKQAKTALQFEDVLSVIHYGAPAQMASVVGHRIESCRFRSRDCSAFCLVTAGKGSMPSISFSRIARTRLRTFAPGEFWRMWDRDQAKFARLAKRLGKRLHIRPNGTTDIMCLELIDRIDADQDVIWYDYTAVPNRVEFARGRPNYHITLSVKETQSNNNWVRQHVSINGTHNAAIVVTQDVKDTLLAHYPERVFDADKHDLRTPEADGIGGRYGLLTPKGKMRGKVSESSMVFGSVERFFRQF